MMSRTAKLIVILVVAAAVAGGGWYLKGRMDKPVPVKTAVLKRGDLTATVTATTTSTIESEHNVTVSAQRMGRIVRLPVEEGDFVKEGQLIAELDRADVLAELSQAGANLALAKSRLAQSEAGMVIEKATSASTVEEAKSVLKESEGNLTRSKTLFERGMISQQDRDAAQRTYDVAKARYESAIASLDVSKVREAEVSAARSSVKQAAAAVESVEVQLGYCTIKSPIDGVISKRPVDIGEMVSLGSVIVEMLDPEDIYVLSTIDEVDVSKLRVGMPVKVHVDALPEKLLDAEITRISPIVSGSKQETRTFEVRTAFREEVEFLKPGMSADIEVISRVMKGIIHVPAQAVLDRDGRKLVYIVEDGKAKLVPVTVGYMSWSDAELTGGIKEGDRVITTPDASGLKDGSKVTEMPGP
ncbi:MAG: efflux RND transporter periplasmic adaptor subunit [Nitrospirae bacterium]|nr:efflux RND transporter periplasmic adaptor subunit [Nitrospirota bacterium]